MAAVRDDEGDQLIDAILLAQHHSDCADARLPGQRGFDLSELDPEAANFHLVVGAAQALHATVWIDARQIARAVQPGLLGTARPWIGEKFLTT